MQVLFSKKLRPEHRKGRRVRVVLVGAAILGVALGICILFGVPRMLLTSPAQISESAIADQSHLTEMNQFVISDHFSEHLTIEIDWIEGLEPNLEAIEMFTDAVKEWLPGKSIEVLLDDAIPNSPGQNLQSTRGGERLNWSRTASSFLNSVFEPSEKKETIYVLYTQSKSYEGFGLQTPLEFTTEDSVDSVETILIFADRIKSIPINLKSVRREVEYSVLVHEMGHALGLVRNPIHRERAANHCIDPGCAMTGRHTRSILFTSLVFVFGKGLPTELCGKCRDDIMRVQDFPFGNHPETEIFLRSLRDSRRGSSEIRMLRNTGQLEIAESHIRKRLSTNPSNFVWHLQLVRVLRGLRRFEEAATAAKNPPDGGPEPQTTRHFLPTLLDAGKFEEALSIGAGEDDTWSCAEVLTNLRTILLGQSRKQARELINRCMSPSLARRVLKSNFLLATEQVALDEPICVAIADATFPEKLDAEFASAICAHRFGDDSLFSKLAVVPSNSVSSAAEIRIRAIAAARIGLLSVANDLADEYDSTVFDPASSHLLRARIASHAGDSTKAISHLDSAQRHGFLTSLSTDPCLDDDYRALISDLRFIKLFPHCTMKPTAN